MKLKLSYAVAALVLAAGGAHAAAAVPAGPAAPVPTGTWVGLTTQTLENLDRPYTTKFVVTAYGGRVLTIVATVRMQCPGDSIRDARAVKSFRTGRGPLISATGGFATKFAGLYGGTVSVAGNLRRTGASGTVSADALTCSGDGTWSGKRRY